MSSKYKYLLLSTYISAFGLVSFPVYAGFEWTPPKNETNVDKKVEKPLIVDIEDEVSIHIPADSDATAPNIIEEDAVIEDDAIDLFPLNNEDKVIISDDDTVVLSSKMDDNSSSSITESVATNSAKDKITWNTNKKFEVIEGFGNNMPLALALRQIVPAKYAFSFGKNINPGRPISWNGSKPWNEVLGDALSPFNIDFKIKENRVILTSDDTSTAVALKEHLSPVKKKKTQINKKKKKKLTPPPVSDVTKDKSNDNDAEISTPIVNSELPKNIEIEEPPALVESNDNNAEISTPIVNSELPENTEINIDKKEINDVDNTTETVEIPAKNIEKEVVIKRSSLLDPGKFESRQPELPENSPSDMGSNNNLEKNKQYIKIDSIDKTNNDDIVNNIDIVEEDAIEKENMEEEDEIIWNNVTNADSEEKIVEEAPVIKEPKFSKAPSNNIIIWEANRGANLRLVLIKWCKEENIKFIWDTDESYKLDKDIFISGTFKSAIDILFSQGVKDAPLYSLTDNGIYELRVGGL